MTDPRALNSAGYFVWNPAGGPPTYRHDDQEAATNEARRLAEQNPGQTFMVVATIGAFSLPKPGPRWTPLEPDDRSIPF